MDNTYSDTEDIISNITHNYDLMNFIEEPLLTEEQRYTLHPIKYPDIWDQFKKQQASFWTAEEIDFSKDKNDWNQKLNDSERYFLKHILAFFAGSDGIVSVNILDNFSKEVKILEAQFTYNFQGTMESIHSEVYSIMIDTYIDNIDDKNILFNAISKIPCVSKKAYWALKWTGRIDPITNDISTITNTNSFAKRLIAFAIVEGLFFSGAFCAIYWIKQRGILPGLTKSNEWIARDEGLHTKFACLLYSKIINKIDQEIVHSMIDEAVEIETEFITDSLPVKLIGMNTELMSQYIKFVADWLLNQLGYDKKYNVKNPFLFMEELGMQSRSNFFDERASTYQNAHIFNTSKKLEVTDDF